MRVIILLIISLLLKADRTHGHRVIGRRWTGVGASIDIIIWDVHYHSSAELLMKRTCMCLQINLTGVSQGGIRVFGPRAASNLILF